MAEYPIIDGHNDTLLRFYKVGDVSKLPNLIEALKASGYDDGMLKKLTHQNWIRVLRQTWKT